MSEKEEAQRILNEVNRQNYAVFPFTLSYEELKRAADSFLDFLESPEKEKISMNLPGSDLMGYAKRQKSKGAFDDKEFFHYHPEISKQFSNINDQKVKTFLENAEKVYSAATSTLSQFCKILSHEEPQFTNKFFKEGKIPRFYLRFIKYEEASLGSQIAAGHYDRGGFALALAESAPGLRIGPLNAAVEVKHSDGCCLFLPGITLNEVTTKIKFQKAWHDVIQKESKPYRPGVGRWAIVFFVDPIEQREVSAEEARTFRY